MSRDWKSHIIVGVASSVVTAAAIVLFGPVWQSSGDGKTIFNRWTGSLIWTYNGLPIEEVHARRIADDAERDRQNAKFLNR